MQEELKIAIKAALEAGKEILEIYELGDFQIELKDDDSPLTIADKKANAIINSYLIPTGTPVISEENRQQDFSDRKDWKECWIVDPLDGTKEFIKRNGEFTVNIAFVKEGKPILGVIFAPAINVLYFAIVSDGKAYKIDRPAGNLEELFRKAQEIRPCGWEDKIIVVGSRSHMNEETTDFIQVLEKKYDKKVEVVSKGSSLKFCLVAEGEAHIYPRYAPTMEWDTAAGQAICEAVGLFCRFRESGKLITYNRENLLNDHFLVSHEG